MKLIAAIGFAASFLFVSTAEAGPWQHSVSFRAQRGTSIRIEKPENFKAEVAGQRDTLPAVFNLPRTNNFVRVTVTAPDGNTFTKKIEVKVNAQTVLNLSYTAPPKKPTEFAGTLFSNGHKCRPAVKYGMVVIAPGAKKGTPYEFRPGERKKMKLKPGTYRIKVNQFIPGRGWKLLAKKQLKVDKANWQFGWGCK